jgi:hypothetical protein
MSHQPSTADLGATIDALAKTLYSQQNHLAFLDKKLETAQAERQDFVWTHVAQVLPDLSRASEEKVQLAFPRFLDSEVLETFRANKKTLGIFKPSGYDNALSALRTRLAFFIDNSRMAPLPRMDEGINALTEERNDTAARQRDTQAILHLLQQAQSGRKPLPPEAQAEVQQLALLAQKTDAARPHGAGSSSYHPDPWLHFMAASPIHLRTLAFGAMNQHYRQQSYVVNSTRRYASNSDGFNNAGGVFVGDAGARSDSGIDFGDPATDADDGIDFGTSNRKQGSDIDFGDDNGKSVATDDRLGAYS